MPRLARLDAPGVLHHVMIRGIERRKIFRNNKDRDDLLERLSVLLPETNTSCYAWALVSNHAHFLFRSGDTGIATLMRRLLTGYVIGFNRRHKRHGQLFQNRYKSIVCQEDTYFLELIRYIHLNPLRTKLVSDLNELNRYPYGGHSVLLGKRKYKWQDSKYVLAYFNRNTSYARKKYQEFVRAGAGQGRRPELTGGGLIRSLGGWAEVKQSHLSRGERIKSDERILGDSDFTLQVLSESKESFERRYRLKSLGYDVERIEKKVVELFSIEAKDLYSGSRKKPVSQARSVFCYWCVRELGESMTNLARTLRLSQPAIGYAVERGKQLVEKKKINLIA